MTGIDLTTLNINAAAEESEKKKGDKKEETTMTAGDWFVVGAAGATLILAGATCYKVYSDDTAE